MGKYVLRNISTKKLLRGSDNVVHVWRDSDEAIAYIREAELDTMKWECETIDGRTLWGESLEWEGLSDD